MRKYLLTLLALIGVCIVSNAKDTVTRDPSVLPKAAQSIVVNNFKSQISIIKIEKSMGAVSEYEVILKDGSEITFDKNGNWNDIEVSRGKAVPASLVPTTVKDYINKKHPKQKIESIEKNRSGFDVELSNGIDLKFDKDGKFLRYDD